MPMSMSGARVRGSAGADRCRAPVLSFSAMVAAHSTVGGRLRQAARVLLVASPGTHWLRIESRIESSYFRQDAAGLIALAGALPAGGTGGADANDEEWRGYYAALLAYRLALLAKDDETRAWPFTQRCIERLNRVLVLDTGSAEALALQSACYALQSDLDPWRSPLAGHLSLARIDKALKGAPDNPRVLLLAALAARERPKLFGGDPQQEFRLMQQAVTAFEREGAQARSLPGWGA